MYSASAALERAAKRRRDETDARELLRQEDKGTAHGRELLSALDSAVSHAPLRELSAE